MYEYVWTIDSFERIAKSYPNSKTMYSEQFVIPLKKRFTVWRLKIYPNGRTPEDTGYITIFLKDSGQIEPAKESRFIWFDFQSDSKNKELWSICNQEIVEQAVWVLELLLNLKTSIKLSNRKTQAIWLLLLQFRSPSIGRCSISHTQKDKAKRSKVESKK